MISIYAIELEKGKYYIGKTSNPQFRLQSHFDSNGSYWTKKYITLIFSMSSYNLHLLYQINSSRVNSTAVQG